MRYRARVMYTEKYKDYSVDIYSAFHGKFTEQPPVIIVSALDYDSMPYTFYFSAGRSVKELKGLWSEIKEGL